MKPKMFILLVIFMTVLGFNYSLNDNGNGSSPALSLKNIEALAQENVTYTRNYKMGSVTKYNSYIIQSTAGAFIWSTPYTFDCCLSATYMEGCNFNAQNSDC